MQQRKDILSDERLKKLPFTVPEGYFDSFRAEMLNTLPEYPERPKMNPLSRWQKIKPYMYLAAMFVGIWCMMKVFHTFTTPTAVSLDNPPESVALALADNNTYDFYTSIYDEEDEYNTEMEVSQMYSNIDDFRRDFINAK